MWNNASLNQENADGGELQPPETDGFRYDLLRIPILKKLLKHRAFQFALQLPNALIFLLVIIAGIWGTQLGDKNFATVITWLVWWAVIIFTFLFLSRTWCMVCPLVAVAEWLQRGRLWKVGNRLFTLNRKWPRRLRNFWVPTVFFIILTWMFLSIGLAENPLYTALVAMGLFIVPAIIISLVFQRRTFCRYVCPIGGVIGAYSMTAPLEIRNRSDEVCRSCKEKACYRGNEKGYGCPDVHDAADHGNQHVLHHVHRMHQDLPQRQYRPERAAVHVRSLADQQDRDRCGHDRRDHAWHHRLPDAVDAGTLDEHMSDDLMDITGLGEHVVLTLSYLAMAVIAPIIIFAIWSLITKWARRQRRQAAHGVHRLLVCLPAHRSLVAYGP